MSPKQPPFQIKVGPIASGNVVVKDGLTWKKLAQRGVRSVLGLEMEAAAVGSLARRLGLHEWVVAKGVMDHADPRKEDRYKEFAARASAEVLFRFLSSQIAARPRIDDSATGSDVGTLVGSDPPRQAATPVAPPLADTIEPPQMAATPAGPATRRPRLDPRAP